MRSVTRFISSLWQRLSQPDAAQPQLVRGLTIRAVPAAHTWPKWKPVGECGLVFHFPRECANDGDGALQRSPAR